VSLVAQSVSGLDIAENFDVHIFNIAAFAGCGRTNRLTREDVAKCSILQLNNSQSVFYTFPRSGTSTLRTRKSAGEK